MENGHNEKLLETCMLALEKVVKNEMEDEISEDLRMVRSKLFVQYLGVVRVDSVCESGVVNEQHFGPEMEPVRICSTRLDR